MKKLTKGQRFALAREARRLAMECVEGTAPEFVSDSFCGCAIGEMLARTGSRPNSGIGQPPNEAWHIADWVDKLLPEHFGSYGTGIVSNALIDNKEYGATQHEAVVFPLLALADALEASAASVPQAPPEVP